MASRCRTDVLGLGILLLALFCSAGCRQPADSRVHVRYWEKWTGYEAQAMQRVVDDFNRSQNRIVVEYLNISQIDRKTLLATAGGDPPDIAGLWVQNLYSFADEGALLPLDDFIRQDGQTPEQWLGAFMPGFADALRYRGRIWGTVSTPTTTLLYYNKAMFRAAGLDPEQPPKTVAELDAMADRLTVREPNGALRQMGFLPQEPGWSSWGCPEWFGGSLFDGKNVTIGTDPKNLAAYKWVEGYSRKYGADTIKRFTAGFGEMASAQSPFFSGRIAMVLNGVWLSNYIRQFAPGLDYGVAPWPVATPERPNFALIEGDSLAIPRGAKHPREAWEFIRYVNTINPKAERFEDLRGMELLCFAHEKISPLREWSPYFTNHHPNPYIKLFREASESPNAVHRPKIGIWEEYAREQSTLFDNVRLLRESPEEALAFCQKRISASWDWHQRSLQRRIAAGVLPFIQDAEADGEPGPLQTQPETTTPK